MMWLIFKELSKRVSIRLCLWLTLKGDHGERLRFQDYRIRLSMRWWCCFNTRGIREYFYDGPPNTAKPSEHVAQHLRARLAERWNVFIIHSIVWCHCQGQQSLVKTSFYKKNLWFNFIESLFLICHFDTGQQAMDNNLHKSRRNHKRSSLAVDTDNLNIVYHLILSCFTFLFWRWRLLHWKGGKF